MWRIENIGSCWVMCFPHQLSQVPVCGWSATASIGLQYRNSPRGRHLLSKLSCDSLEERPDQLAQALRSINLKQEHGSGIVSRALRRAA
jgi:hypothetical protein